MVHLTREGTDGITQFLYVGTVHRVRNLYAIQEAGCDRGNLDYVHRGSAITALKRRAMLEDLTTNIMWR